jgi:hypothetical protein
MEEKELELTGTEPAEVPQEQPKKKGGKTSKKKETAPVETTEDNPVEAPAETAEENPVEEVPASVEVAETTEEKQGPEKEVKPDEKKDTEQAIEPEEKPARRPVPSPAQLRKLRKFNESIFTFEDGFACLATSQRVADSKHEAWLKD